MVEINPENTKRAEAFKLWMNAPMPMVTFMKKLDVSHLVRMSRRKGLKFNMLMCYCIGRAASRIEDFYVLPVGEKLMQYDSIAVNTIVANRKGAINSCDLPFSDNLHTFGKDYLKLTSRVYDECANYDLEDSMVIGTSAIVNSELDGIVNMYSGIFNNPFMFWSRYSRHFLKTTLNVSFQFHHVQMDGATAAHFLNLLQQEICSLKV